MMMKSILGVITLLIGIFYTVVLAMVFYIFGIIKLLTPSQRCRERIHLVLNKIIVYWNDCHSFLTRILIGTTFQVDGDQGLNNKRHQFIIANHISTVDILVLMMVFRRKIPVIHFPIKKQLLWLPIIGIACWLADLPVLRRYNKKTLQKYPQLRGQDMKRLEQLCKKFTRLPLTLGIFVEGTRYGVAKAKQQCAPYCHLLKPRAGGCAMALQAMGKQLTHILDVTIAYPGGKNTFWQFVCGRIRRVLVKIEKIPVTKDLVGDYINDAHYRQHIQQWLNHLWHHKDIKLQKILG